MCYDAATDSYGILPDNAGDISPTEEAFLDHAVRILSDDGRVVSLRLALFADMVKSKPWTPATLKASGGAEGIGVTFLEETFASAGANPKHRVHASAAQEVLRALLPTGGLDIKGHMKSYTELLNASPYAQQQRDFDELLGVLDTWHKSIFSYRYPLLG